MSPAQLLSYFDRLSETPDAVPRLRHFILDLAVRGKIVEQELSDEPASELLKRIQVEKARLVKAGDIRRQVDFSQVGETEFPFEIPASWCWVRLIDVLIKLTDGTHHSPTNLENGDFKYITAKNIKPEGVSLAEVSYVSANVHHGIYARCNPEKGDILYIKDGATTGILTINDLDEPFSMLSSVALLKLSTGVYNRLIAEFLRSPFFYIQMRGFMKGAAITRVTLKRMAPALVPLPPFAEQHRIVAKIDELMTLCDRLGAAQAERETQRYRLVEESLQRMNNGADPDAFREHARFYFNHLPRLTTCQEHIYQLRQTILNLGVRGQLAPQDPNDEPAFELRTRIQAEKARLVKAGKIKAQEPQPPITKGEIEYDLPTNWLPTRIGDLLTVIRGASPRPKGDPKYFSTERTPYHWIKISDIRKHSKDRVLYDTDEFLTEAGMERSVLLPKDTLVVTNSATIGVPIILGFEGGCIHDGYLAFPYFPSTELSKDFFFVLFQTLQAYAVRKARGMAQLNLNTGLVREFPLGLPPLAEQHRIVAKVEELMAMCDRLEEQLTTTQTESHRFLEAVLHDALAGQSEFEQGVCR